MWWTGKGRRGVPSTWPPPPLSDAVSTAVAANAVRAVIVVLVGFLSAGCSGGDHTVARADKPRGVAHAVVPGSARPAETSPEGRPSFAAPLLRADPATARQGQSITLTGTGCSQPELYWHNHGNLIHKNTTVPIRLPIRVSAGGGVHAIYRVRPSDGVGTGLFALLCSGSSNSDTYEVIK